MSYFTIDFGVNFADEKRYGDAKIDKLMQDAWDKGVEKVVCICNSYKEVKRVLSLQSKHENMYFTLGIHPHTAKNYDRSILDIIRKNMSNKKFFAIGECGLDYDRLFSTRDEQLYVFEEQVKLAKELGKKLYLHCRNKEGNDAFTDMVRILTKYNYFNGIVHCFTGNLYQAKYFTESGLKLGITGWILDDRRNHDLVHALKYISVNDMLVETDAPYMPDKKNGSRESTPPLIWTIIARIAEIKNMDRDRVGEIIYDNSLRFLS